MLCEDLDGGAEDYIRDGYGLNPTWENPSTTAPSVKPSEPSVMETWVPMEEPGQVTETWANTDVPFALPGDMKPAEEVKPAAAKSAEGSLAKTGLTAGAALVALGLTGAGVALRARKQD